MKQRKQRRTRKQRGGICPCVMQQQQHSKNDAYFQSTPGLKRQQRSQQQKGGFAVTLMNQFTTAASLLTPIAVALGIKAYRDSKKGRGKKTRRAR